MPDRPILIDPPARMVRVERLEPALRYSRITAETAGLDRSGNRFDVPGAGVLYAASTEQGAFAETTAHFRRSASVLERMAKAGATVDELQIPSVDASWRATRVVRSLCTREALPFVDIEAAQTHTYLTEHARSVLLSLGVPVLDVPAVRGHSRRLTRGLATWIYQARDDAGEPLYGVASRCVVEFLDTVRDQLLVIMPQLVRGLPPPRVRCPGASWSVR